ncbi:MAG: alpha/beta hydrolase [Actinomycetota bacterium]|nr:alpha/beta hydrolase [Actinomycetota bacterium]
MTELDRERVDPDLLPYVGRLVRSDLTDIDEVRASAAPVAAVTDPEVRVSSIAVPGPPGAPDVRVQLYDGRSTGGERGAVLHVHGGAFVSGTPEFEGARCTYLARGARCLVASVDYRLAPEHRYPAGLEDCAAAFDWLVARSGELGLDPDRIGVGGSSAGGCLAAALALRGRDGIGSRAAFALLVYPVTDWTASSASVRRFEGAPGFSGRNVAQMWSLYLTPGQEPDAYASPALAADLSGLPPTYVSVVELDPLRDEGIELARRMIAADVPVELRVFPGLWHGFDLDAPGSGPAREFRDAEVGALRRFLGLGRQPATR